uniref:uncharacterized protein LOC122580545 isoform X2 n=1 Tax=Erigeron canadensis TaxID=72917 RepID=UPI001CB97C85|nr:uncharacterized protein LOC122580545 isoform X2 [Erigeron canadensis]
MSKRLRSTTTTQNHNHDDDHGDIPFDIQTEIIKRIQDVKSLMRCRSVSKPCNKRDNEMQSTDQMDHVAGLKGSDVDGSFGGEEDYYEDEDSDSEYASIQRPAFYVSGEPDFDSGPPQDGLEYLRRVRWETKHIPKVKVAKVDKSVLNKEQTVYMPRIPDIAVCEHLMPSKEWENVFLADFSKLRMRRFSLPQGDNVDKVLLDTFNEKFRSLKKRLKDKLLKLAAKKLDEANIGGDDVQYTMDDLLNALDMVSPPENFLDHQWEVFKNNLRSPTAKKLSKYGKDARAGKLHYHSTGAVSFARKKDEFMVINKREANDVEFFEDSHLMKDGKYAKHASEELLNQAKEGIARKISEVSSFDSIDPEKRSEIVREVMKELRGRSKRGRPPGYGAGVKRSQVSKFSFDLRKLRGKTIENENRYLLDKVDTQSKQIESQRIQIETQSKQIENQSNQMSKMQKTLDQCTGELQLFRTAFSDFCGPRMSIPPQATSSAFHQDHR